MTMIRDFSFPSSFIQSHQLPFFIHSIAHQHNLKNRNLSIPIPDTWQVVSPHPWVRFSLGEIFFIAFPNGGSPIEKFGLFFFEFEISGLSLQIADLVVLPITKISESFFFGEDDVVVSVDHRILFVRTLFGKERFGLMKEPTHSTE